MEKQNGRPGLWLAETSETPDRNSTKLDWKQDLNPLYQVFSSQSEKQDGLLGLWLAETFWNSPSETTERNSMKLDRKQDINVLYQVCVFRADRKSQMATLASDCWDISTSPLKLLNRIQRNLTGIKISNVLYRVGIIWADQKNSYGRMGVWFDFSSETAERRATKLYRKKDLNVPLPFPSLCFWADRKNKIAALANSSKRWHIVLRCTICGLWDSCLS